MQIKRQMIMALLAGVLLASCAGQATGEPTVDVNAIMTAGVGTFVVALSQTQAAQATLATQTPSPTLTVSPVSLNSVTPLPTSTQVFLLPLPTIFIAPTVTGTQYTPTVNPSSLGTGCNNLLLIRDESIPAGTVMEPGQEFTKIWKVENNGTCDWVYLYRLVFISGDRMEGEPSGLGKVITPGKWTQLSVGLKAPSKPGTYTGYWRFGNQSGSVFGSTLTVSIVVANPTSTPVTPSYP
jgi:hypothetical protein